jgi:hypothetical protein
MNDKEYLKLKELARDVDVILNSPRRFVFPIDHIALLSEKVSKLIGYILAFDKS